MIGVVALPRLPSEVLALPEGELRAVVVDDTGGSRGKKAGPPFVLRSVAVIVDATEAARAQGVRPGMRILDAQRYVPTLLIDVVTSARLKAELDVVAEVLLACSPVVEPVLPATWSGLPMAAVALDLGGMVRPVERILVDIRRACARLKHRSVAVASPGTRLSKALVRTLAAEATAGGKVTSLEVRIEDVPAALGRLPVSALELSAELATSLHALGARTAADLERLLPKGGVERLGDEASVILDTLQCKRTPLSGITPPVRVFEEMELEHPLTALEPLVFILNRLCNRICIRVRARRQRVAELTLHLRTFRDRQSPTVLKVAFPDPTADEKAMLRTLTVRLERTALKDPIDRIVLEATRLARRGPQQLSLLEGAGLQVKAEEALQGLLAEMSAELGTEQVGCLVVTDAPLPEAMTRLAWPPPPPPPRPPAPERRRPRKTPALPTGAVTSSGRFIAGWPWPLRLLPSPLRLGWDVRVARRELLGILEGEDARDAPYARIYEVLVLADGRRAMALFDEELEETWVVGWFD